jgi:hypothetical protein
LKIILTKSAKKIVFKSSNSQIFTCPATAGNHQINIMQTSSLKNNRRKILLSMGAILSLFTLAKFRFFSSFNNKKNITDCSPANQTGTMKFLTQDGTLVEVDISKIKSDRKKISNQELMTWVKK